MPGSTSVTFPRLMFPTIPPYLFSSKKNSAKDPSSTTATRISGPSALTASMFCMKALQFVVPAPEIRDIDVATCAPYLAGLKRVGSTRLSSIQGIAESESLLAHRLLRLGRAGVLHRRN